MPTGLLSLCNILCYLLFCHWSSGNIYLLRLSRHPLLRVYTWVSVVWFWYIYSYLPELVVSEILFLFFSLFFYEITNQCGCLLAHSLNSRSCTTYIQKLHLMGLISMTRQTYPQHFNNTILLLITSKAISMTCPLTLLLRRSETILTRRCSPFYLLRPPTPWTWFLQQRRQNRL